MRADLVMARRPLVPKSWIEPTVGRYCAKNVAARGNGGVVPASEHYQNPAPAIEPRRGFVSTESASPADSAAGCSVFLPPKNKSPAQRAGLGLGLGCRRGSPSTSFLCCQPACRLETTGFHVGLHRARSQSTVLFCC